MKKEKESKTNAMRQLDKAQIAYQLCTYDISIDDFSGVEVSKQLGIPAEACFKTLALTHENDLYICVVPVAKEMDLKKAAAQIGVKDLHMIAVKDLLKKVGYQRGSVSPLGIIAKHKTYFDQSVENHEEIEISAGKFGYGLKVNVQELLRFLKAEVKDLCC